MDLAQTLQHIHPRSLKFLSDQLTGLVAGRLWLKVLFGMVLGVAVGVALGPSVGWVRPAVAAAVTGWLALPGQIFLALVQMIVVPLVFASIIRGLASSENLEQLRKLGTYALVFFVTTTALAIVIGIGFALLVQPGDYVDPQLAKSAIGQAQATAIADAPPPAPDQSIPETIAELLPKNPLGAMVELEMLQVVLFAIILGIALVSLPPRDSTPLLSLLGSLQQVCMAVVRWAMKLAPFAVFGLMARLTASIGLEALLGMGIYVCTVIAGLFAMMIAYVIIAWVLGGHSPGRFLGGIRGVALLAFSTSSSAAVMPLSIKAAEEKLSARPSTTQLIIPLGATLNMAGTALYQGVATIFLAQVFGVTLGTGELALLVVTAVAASIGSPATPGVGIVILSMVLSSVGVPAAGIALIIGVDRILDMCRTAVNVTGDLVAVAVLDRFVGGVLSAEEQWENETERERRRKEEGRDVIVRAAEEP